MYITTLVVVGKEKATTGAHFRYWAIKLNVEKHQSFSMGSNLTSIDFQVCAAEIYNITIKKQNQEIFDMINLETN